MTQWAFIIVFCFWFDGQIVCDIASNSAVFGQPKLYATEAECQDAANFRVMRGGPDTGTWRALCYPVTTTEATVP